MTLINTSQYPRVNSLFHTNFYSKELSFVSIFPWWSIISVIERPRTVASNRSEVRNAFILLILSNKWTPTGRANACKRDNLCVVWKGLIFQNALRRYSVIFRCSILCCPLRYRLPIICSRSLRCGLAVIKVWPNCRAVLINIVMIQVTLS
jgi:hypothetical protein